MVKRGRRMTVRKKTTKKAASKMKPSTKSRRSVKRKPASTMQGDRANKAMKALLKALNKQTEDSE